MTDPLYKNLARVLAPLAKRMRRDVTARKGANGSYWTDEPLTMAMLEHHVNGGPARGLCPIREGESVTMVACLDFDSHKGEVSWPRMVQTVSSVADQLARRGLQPHPFRSTGGNGVHLLLTWASPQDAYSVRCALGGVLTACGLKDGAGGLVKGQVEVFPRQDEVGPGEHGNQFILPLAGKSVPLDPLFDYEPMSKEHALGLQWQDSEPVPPMERPVRAASAGAAEPEALSVVREALFAIPNDPLFGDAPTYFQWRDLCFAVHEATAGSDEGYEMFAEWSAQNPAHDEKFARKRVWDKVKDADRRSSGAITRGTLFHTARQAGWAGGMAPEPDADGFEDVESASVRDLPGAVVDLGPSRSEQRAVALAEERNQLFEAKEHWKKAILDAADERALMTDVCPQVAACATLDSVVRGLLADVLKGKLVTLGSKASIADCRKLIAPLKKERNVDESNWTTGWVYVTDEDAFFRMNSEEVLSMQGFNAKFNRFLPPAEEGEYRKTAGWVALEDYRLRTVTRRIYLPWAGPTFEMNGVECANRFRPSSMPELAREYTPAGRAALARIQAHLRLIVGGREDALGVLLSWMAYNVQYPGKKIRWAPLVKGVQGDGKTLIGRVLAAALGVSNVKDISPKVLSTQFTDWAHGACIGILEEIRLSGQNRYEIMDAMKPYVSNSTVEIHPKGSAPFNTVNTMNYLAFTNHADALPIDDTDRRWFIIFTPFLQIADLEKLVGERGRYFDVLYDDLEQHQGEIRKWLAEYELHPAFKADGNAPKTEEKGSMAALSVSAEEEAIVSVLERGAEHVTDKVLTLRGVRNALSKYEDVIDISEKDIARVLTRLGWLKVAGQIKWESRAVRVWVKGLDGSNTAEIRAHLSRSVEMMCDLGSAHDLFA